jgi:hypothetical protein
MVQMEHVHIIGLRETTTGVALKTIICERKLYIISHA